MEPQQYRPGAAPRGPRSANHSIRCTNELWAAAKRRAAHEGVTLNQVLSEILEGYAMGKINLPKIIKKF